MAEPRTLTVYIDYKSPYAYLAKDRVYELERDCAVRIDWLPHDLDLADFMGSARVDDSGSVIEEQRTAHGGACAIAIWTAAGRRESAAS
jgi:hypothetical protein